MKFMTLICLALIATLLVAANAAPATEDQQAQPYYPSGSQAYFPSGSQAYYPSGSPIYYPSAPHVRVARQAQVRTTLSYKYNRFWLRKFFALFLRCLIVNINFEFYTTSESTHICLINNCVHLFF